VNNNPEIYCNLTKRPQGHKGNLVALQKSCIEHILAHPAFTLANRAFFRGSDRWVDNMQNVVMMIKYKDSNVPSLSLL